MSQNSTTSTSALGDYVQILRQRYFVNHNPDAKTLLVEEYTIIGNKNKVDNIILQSYDFLPNLTVYDSDGEELPIMPNNYTLILIESWIKQARDEKQQNHLRRILKEIESKKLYLIWIKLPPGKKLEMNQSKVISLKYAAKKEKSKNKIIWLELFSNKNHSIFYIIKYPEDHFLNNRKIKFTQQNGKKQIRRGWKKHTRDRMYFTETNDSICITVKPNLKNQVVLLYKFAPARHIIAFPILVIAFLTLSSLYLVELSSCPVSSDDMTTNCLLPEFLRPGDPSYLLSRSVDIGVAIIVASFVLPRLIRNAYIRHRMLLAYFVPVFFAVFLLIQ